MILLILILAQDPAFKTFKITTCKCVCLLTSTTNLEIIVLAFTLE